VTVTSTDLRPPSPPMDPRIKARRMEVRRREGRRRLQRLFDLSALAVVVAAFAAALQSPLLDVDEVVVAGADRTGAAEVLEASEVDRGDALVSIDLRAVGRRVTALPWVREVAVSRDLGGTVRLDVSERTPVAEVDGGTGVLLVDVEGRVLGPAVTSQLPGPLVRVEGGPAAPSPGDQLGQDLRPALRLAAALSAAAPGAVASLVVEDGSVAGLLATGGTVGFGTGDQAEAQARSLRTMLDQVDLSCLATLDLSLPGSPVLTRVDGCS